MKYQVQRDGMPHRIVDAADAAAACKAYDAEFGILKCNRPFAVSALSVATAPIETPSADQQPPAVPVTPRPPTKKAAKKSAEPKP